MSSSCDLIHSYLFFFAAKGSKIIFGFLVALVLLAIVYWMLRSIGIDRNTPPSMVGRRIMSFFRSTYRPLLMGGYWKRAARLEENSKFDGAVDVYLQLFDFDGLINTRASIAILNDRVLEHLEELCVQVGYPFPTQRIDRLREDIYDYFLVKQKYLAPSDFDGTELIRPENEHRFSEKLNLSQEYSLVDGFRNFLESFARKLKQHILSGAPPIVTAEQQQAAQHSLEMSVPDNGALPSSMAFESIDPFGVSRPISGDEIAAPADLFNPPVLEASQPPALTPAPGIFGAGVSTDAPLPPPPDSFVSGPGMTAPSVGGPPVGGPPSLPVDANPFSFDDPRVPHHEATGRLHKLPGSEDDSPFQSGPPSEEEATQTGPAPIPASAPPGFPQPTGGFPGFASQPQPTGGFPGFSSQPPGSATPPPNVSGAPGFPQPTGGFPGFSSQPPGPATTPSGTPGFPQPTGGFPGFNSQPPGPATSPSGAPGFPQPTGGFPGFSSQPPGPATPPPNVSGAPGFPQPTGGFPGFASLPPGPVTPPPSGGGFPQPTGGFPGFPSTPPDEEKK